jgi:hypothetical protein
MRTSSAPDGSWSIRGRTAPWRDGAEIEVSAELTEGEREDYAVLPASRRRSVVGDVALDFTIVPRRPEVETTIRFVYTGTGFDEAGRDPLIDFRVLAGTKMLWRDTSPLASGENLLTARLPMPRPAGLTLELTSVLGFLRCPLAPETPHCLFGEGGSWERRLRVSGYLLVEGAGPEPGTAVAIYGIEPRDLPSSAWSIFPTRDGESVSDTTRQLPPRGHPPYEIVPCSAAGHFELRLPPGTWWLRAERAVPLAFWRDGAPTPWLRIVVEAEDLDLRRLHASSKH